MRNILLAILVSSSALLVGCTDDLSMDTRDIEAQPIDPTSAARRPELAAQSDAPAHDTLAKQDALSEVSENFCAELPSDGPCSLACDPDALIDQHVPHGTCVTFRCELASGEVFLTGGCNP